MSQNSGTRDHPTTSLGGIAMNSTDFIGIQQDTKVWKAFTKLAFGVAMTFSLPRL
jgi:hypothetical protein